METIGNKTAILFPMCAICFHFSSLLHLKLLALSQLGSYPIEKSSWFLL
jgi:hypothetical protein